MGLDLWFRADVARILQATHEAMTMTAAAVGDQTDDDIGARERAAGYRQGFGAALRAVATAFGLNETQDPSRIMSRVIPTGELFPRPLQGLVDVVEVDYHVQGG